MHRAVVENWDEVRTAYQVARKGTVSGAAEVLGVHHATVIRHIDSLEQKLGVKLFQRHARGYTATEAGEDLCRVAQATEDQFNQLQGRIRGQGDAVSGELVVTSLVGMAPLLAPVMSRFQRDFPDITLRYLTGDRLFRLEYGEAHVAIRAGSAPEQPDNVVQPFFTGRLGVYAAESYIRDYGRPRTDADLATHRWVAHDNPQSRAPMYRWLFDSLPNARLVFRSADPRALEQAVIAGVGLGFMPDHAARRHPDMVQIMPHRSEWSAPHWLVTHVDLHRSAKVQSFLKYLKAQAKIWEAEAAGS